MSGVHRDGCTAVGYGLSLQSLLFRLAAICRVLRGPRTVRVVTHLGRSAFEAVVVPDKNHPAERSRQLSRVTTMGSLGVRTREREEVESWRNTKRWQEQSGT